jgi:hypothetical protein
VLRLEEWKLSMKVKKSTKREERAVEDDPLQRRSQDEERFNGSISGDAICCLGLRDRWAAR